MPQATITSTKIQTLVRQEVLHSLREILVDPDFELELKPSAVKRLQKSVSSYNKGLAKPLNEIMAKYHLK